MNRGRKMFFIAVASMVSILVITLVVRYYWVNSEEYKLEEAYNILKKGTYLDYSRRIELDTMAKNGNMDAKVLYGLDVFFEYNRNALDSIYSETVAAKVNYRNVFKDADYYLNWEYSGKYQEFFYEIKSHVNALKKKNPENIRFDSEEKMYVGKLPQAGMKTIYFDVCSLGVPSTSKTEMEVVGSGSHIAYDWIVDGKQIFRADATHGYVYATYDFRYKLDEKNTASAKNDKYYKVPSGGSSWSSYGDPFDVKHYSDGDDFADEWEDEFDDWDDAFSYWEENY